MKSTLVIRFDIYAIRDVFFEYICNLMKDVDSHIKLISKSDYFKQSTSLLNEKEFLSKKKDYKPFFQEFIKTQMFTIFLESILYDSIPEINYFQQIKKQKRNKKNLYLIKEYQTDKILYHDCLAPDSQKINPKGISLIRYLHI